MNKINNFVITLKFSKFLSGFHSLPSQVDLAENDEHPPGLILSNGDINWNCPCLGGMAIGPCGIEFRDAFSCFHYSEVSMGNVEVAI